MTKDLERS